VAFSGLPGKFLTALAGATTLSVGAGGKPVVELPVPASAKAATEALRQCEAVKAVDWGADPAIFQGGAAAKPIGDTGKWIDQRDLGSVNTWHQFGAGATFRLVVGPDGKVERCDVLEASLNSGLRANGCKSLTAHARYEPAKDGQGRPVRSAFAYSAGFQVFVTFEVR
jgi:protein TonB